MWIARLVRSARAWSERQLLPVRVCLNLALLSVISLTAFGMLWIGVRGFELYRYWYDFTPEDRAYWRHANVGYANHGLPSVGRRLKAEMESVPDPETALRLHPEWATRRFKNGEWVIWHSLKSMLYFKRGAGTAVVKDSTGRVRIYFGFVKFENQPLSDGWESLKEYDELLTRSEHLREWVPPP